MSLYRANLDTQHCCLSLYIIVSIHYYNRTFFRIEVNRVAVESNVFKPSLFYIVQQDCLASQVMSPYHNPTEGTSM